MRAHQLIAPGLRRIAGASLHLRVALIILVLASLAMIAQRPTVSPHMTSRWRRDRGGELPSPSWHGSWSLWSWGCGSVGADAQYRLVVARLEALTGDLRRRQGAIAASQAGSSQGADDLGEGMDAAAAVLGRRGYEQMVQPPVGLLLPYEAQPVRSTVFITYGDALFNRSKLRLAGEAARFGVFDRIRAWGPEDIDLNFVQRNYAILTQLRGGGYWLWKPYVIWEALREMADGDVLMYADAGCTFLSSPEPYLRLATQFGLVAFRVPHKMGEYTKGIVFHALDMPMGMWAEELQVIAGILVVQKRPFTSFLISEWLRLCQDERLITDADTSAIAPNHASFIDHRHDQSIWSLLVHKYGACVCPAREFSPLSRSFTLIPPSAPLCRARSLPLSRPNSLCRCANDPRPAPLSAGSGIYHCSDAAKRIDIELRFHYPRAPHHRRPGNHHPPHPDSEPLCKQGGPQASSCCSLHPTPPHRDPGAPLSKRAPFCFLQQL